MGIFSKHGCHCEFCFPSDESERLSEDSPASPPQVVSSVRKDNTAALLSGSHPVPTLPGTAGGWVPLRPPGCGPTPGSQSPTWWTSDPAHFGFCRPTVYGSSPMPGSQSRVLGASTPAPTHFTFPPQGCSTMPGCQPQALGTSSPAVTSMPAPTGSIFGAARLPPFGGSLMPGCQSQPLGKSNPAAATTPSATAVFTFPPHDASPMHRSQFQPPRKSNPTAMTASLFTTTGNPCTANGQAHAVKDSSTHSLPQNNVFASSVSAFASSPGSSLQNPSSVFAQQSPNGLFPERPDISPPLARNPRQAPPAGAIVAPIFSWTQLPAFGGSTTCERGSSFRPTSVPSEGVFPPFHSMSADPGNRGSSPEEIRWEHCQNNPMQGKTPVMMIPVIPLPGGGFSILTIQSNVVQPANTIHQATEPGLSSSVPGNN